METLFKKIKTAFPKAVVQSEKNYVSFTFGGGLYYQLRVQKDIVRMMATNYPNKAKIGECLKLIKKHSIEGQDVNGNEIIFEVGARNPEIFTLRIEMPYNSGQLEKDSFINGVVDSCAIFHDILLPLVNNFIKEPVSDLYSLMGGTNNVSPAKTVPHKPAFKKVEASNSSTTLQQQIATAILASFPEADVKKIDKDNYLDIHIPSVHPKKGTHIGINTAKGLIKIVFYCRDEQFNEQALSNSKKIEAYAQGLRIKDNPAFNTVDKAVEAAIDFLLDIKRASGNSTSVENDNEKNSIAKKKAIPKKAAKKKDYKPSEEEEENETEDDSVEDSSSESSTELNDLFSKILGGNFTVNFVANRPDLISAVADSGDLEEVKSIIKKGETDINVRDTGEDAYTAVHFAAWDGKVEILEYLIKSGADPDVVGNDGDTALHLAASTGKTECVKVLLEAVVDMERRRTCSQPVNSKKGDTSLRAAFMQQHWPIIDLLIENGADISVLLEPCAESIDGETDLFIITKNEARKTSPRFMGKFDKRRLDELEKASRETTSLNSNKSSVKSKRAGDVNKESVSQEQDDNDIPDLEDFDVNEDQVIKNICDKIKSERYLTNLLYVNNTLSSKGYSVDNHHAYFFDSSVLISDKELEGFLVVNMDGFYSNCMNENELSPIFSWSGVNDIEYEEVGEDCSIDIVADQGRLTIKKEGSHSLKILYTFYKSVWEQVNDEFKDQSMILWNQVWDMGIKEVGFSEFNDYLTFDVSKEEEELDEEVDESDEQESEVELKEDKKQEEIDEEEQEKLFFIGKDYELEFARLLEIAEKTGILVNDIKEEPNDSERDELWGIVRVFAKRIYEIDNEENLDKEELNTLCFYAIVALHWCDIFDPSDERYSLENGRFRRDTVALAICFYSRIDRSFKYYDFIKESMVMPHMQFSILMWSINTIINNNQDTLFGLFTPGQAEEANNLFKELTRKNGGADPINPNEVPEDHPLRSIWWEIYRQFNNVRIPYQFIKSYISQIPPKRSFLQNLFGSNKGNVQPGMNVSLLEEDRNSNVAFLDKQIAHKQFPQDWFFANDIAYLNIYFAKKTDENLANSEISEIQKLVAEWISETDENKLKQITTLAYDKAKSLFDTDSSTERFAFVLENIRRHILVFQEYDEEKTKGQLKLILDDLLVVSEADDEVKETEIDMIDLIKNEWGLQWGSEQDE